MHLWRLVRSSVLAPGVSLQKLPQAQGGSMPRRRGRRFWTSNSDFYYLSHMHDL